MKITDATMAVVGTGLGIPSRFLFVRSLYSRCLDRGHAESHRADHVSRLHPRL